MSDLAARIRRLSPRQQELLRQRMREKERQSAPAAKVSSPPSARADDKDDNAQRTMDFTLFFFSADGTREEDERYSLLLECARRADRHGFKAVWTPERHFQAFGGLYPNPSVLSAALAMVTERVRIRAGSVVLPLHSPVRVAEEWAVVDNLSRGRVGISFATGWHAHDYVISPANYEERRELMFRGIPVVCRLWAGEEVELPGVDGVPTRVRTLPRPIQRELPFWITASSPRTWRQAGEIGGNVLSSMIGLGVGEVAELVRGYRRARTENGHDPRTGIVSLMLHTYLGSDPQATREKVREPMKRYLSNFVDQFRPLVETAPAGSDELDSLLDFAFERYYETSSLLGTPEKCAGLVAALADAGVDEVACLVDFGLDAGTTLEGLEQLAGLRRTFAANPEEETIPEEEKES